MQSLPSSADAPGIPGEHHTFFKLLEYLNRSGSINQQQYEHLKLKVPLSGGLNLDRILGLFAEQDWMQKFRSSLPANSATSANLIAKNFEFSPPSYVFLLFIIDLSVTRSQTSKSSIARYQVNLIRSMGARRGAS